MLTRKDIDKLWVSDKIVDIQYPDTNSVGDRYDLKSRYVDELGIARIRPLRRLDVRIKYDPDDIYYVVKPHEQFRPDIIAKRFLMDPRLYWIILSANDMKEPFELEAGLNIRIPSYSSVFSVGGVMMR